jgi:hypothetical protein
VSVAENVAELVLSHTASTVLMILVTKNNRPWRFSLFSFVIVATGRCHSEKGFRMDLLSDVPSKIARRKLYEQVCDYLPRVHQTVTPNTIRTSLKVATNARVLMNYIYSIKRMPFISIIESIPEAQN